MSRSYSTFREQKPYLINYKGTDTQPVIGKNRDVREFYERPGGNEGPNASMTTNDINTAMDFLKESIEPSYGNQKEKDQKEFNTGAYNKKKVSRPPMTIFPLPIASWRTTTKMSGPADTKVKPKDYDSEEEEEQEESRNPLGKFNELKIANYRGGEKPLDRYVSPKPFGQTEIAGSKKKNSEKIDSREASRRYGKLPPTEEEDYEGILTSEEAMVKYKGALVPPTGTRTTNTRISKN